MKFLTEFYYFNFAKYVDFLHAAVFFYLIFNLFVSLMSSLSYLVNFLLLLLLFFCLYIDIMKINFLLFY